MKIWQTKAVECFPELRALIEETDSPMMLWTEFNALLAGEYSKEVDDRVIARFYGFARWCYFDSGDRALQKAVGCGFYEHILHTKSVREDAYRWISATDFSALKPEFLGFAQQYEVDSFEKEFTAAQKKTRAQPISHSERP